MVVKNQEYEVNIIDMGMELEGICKINDFTVFVPFAIVGEKVRIKIIKVLKKFAYGKVINIIEKSPYREEILCQSFGKCGGCSGQHINYSKLLEIKKSTAINTLRKQNICENIESKVECIYGMGSPYNYRNKIQYPVCVKNGKINFGMYKKNTHDVIYETNCILQDEVANEIANRIFECIEKHGFKGYDEENNIGDIKHVIIKRGYHTEEVMCIFVVTSRDVLNTEVFKKFILDVKKINSKIVSIYANINNKKNNVILTDINILVSGREYITDYIGEYKYAIAADSFFQVNTLQAEVLYNLLKEKMKLEKEKTLLELYSGVGSIGIFLANNIKSVTGVEIVESAVKMAKLNVKLNDLSNLTYELNDASKAVVNFKKQNKQFDYLVVDPPRKGLDENEISVIKEILPKKIGYVSCSVATLARDLKLLSNKYEIDSINMVDMFPWTPHVECVCVLNRQ